MGLSDKIWKGSTQRPSQPNLVLTIFTTPFETTFLVQVMFGKPCCQYEFKFTAIVLNIARHKLFKPVGIKRDEIDKRSFLKLSFANKGLDAINLGNILHHKSEKSKIPPYFRDQSVPIILYTYTTPIATKIFNYKKVLQDLKSKPPDCTCASSPFIYNPAGHITGDLNITNNSFLRDVFAKGSKYPEPKSINWKHNFKFLMDSVKDYARQWEGGCRYSFVMGEEYEVVHTN